MNPTWAEVVHNLKHKSKNELDQPKKPPNIATIGLKIFELMKNREQIQNYERLSKKGSILLKPLSF
jgi:hypothetical protein